MRGEDQAVGQQRHCGSQHEPTTGKTTPTAALAALRPPRLTDKTYHGKRGRDGSPEVWVEESRLAAVRRREATTVRSLPLHLEVRNHSPTGFAWGYGGSGPAQLALALLLDATGDENLALLYYQELKRQVVAGWKESWSITATEIRGFAATQEKQATVKPIAATYISFPAAEHRRFAGCAPDLCASPPKRPVGS